MAAVQHLQPQDAKSRAAFFLLQKLQQHAKWLKSIKSISQRAAGEPNSTPTSITQCFSYPAARWRVFSCSPGAQSPLPSRVCCKTPARFCRPPPPTRTVRVRAAGPVRSRSSTCPERRAPSPAAAPCSPDGTRPCPQRLPRGTGSCTPAAWSGPRASRLPSPAGGFR